jgi:hypothetical protein
MKIRAHVTYSVSKRSLYYRTRKLTCVVPRLYGSPFVKFPHTFLFIFTLPLIFAGEDWILT